MLPTYLLSHALTRGELFMCVVPVMDQTLCDWIIEIVSEHVRNRALKYTSSKDRTETEAIIYFSNFSRKVQKDSYSGTSRRCLEVI